MRRRLMNLGLACVLGLGAAGLIWAAMPPESGGWLVVVEGREGEAPHVDGPWSSKADAESNASLWRADKRRVLGVMTAAEFGRRITNP